MSLEKNFSIYLDLMRFLAALSVFIGHSTQYHLYRGYVPFGQFSHDAVIVFFVLSGLVIATTAARPSETWKTYAIARTSRIYSVAIPAIALCYAVKGFAAFLEPNLRSQWLYTDLSVSVPVSALLFLLQSWGDRALPWNGPYWSLCYEVWYYVIFGAIFFIRNPKLGTTVALLATLIAGPAIIVLFPVWLLGVWVARHPHFSIGSKAVSCAIFLGSFAAFVLLNCSGISDILKVYLSEHIPAFWRLSSSQFFLTDYVVGLLVVLNFISFRAIQGYLTTSLRISAPAIRFVAGYTFSLYLYHFPMVRFCETVFPNTDNSRLYYVFTMAAIFGLCLLLGHFTEKQKWIVRAFVVWIASAVRRSGGRVRSAASIT